VKRRPAVDACKLQMLAKQRSELVCMSRSVFDRSHPDPFERTVGKQSPRSRSYLDDEVELWALAVESQVFLFRMPRLEIVPDSFLRLVEREVVALDDDHRRSQHRVYVSASCSWVSSFETLTPTSLSAPGRSASARSRSPQASSPILSASAKPAGRVVERLRIEKSG